MSTPLSPAGVRRTVEARFERPIVALLLLIFLTLGWRGRMPVMIVGGDDLTYVALSHSLEQGDYREVFSATAPRHVRYPPGYPAWLVAARTLGGDSHDLAQAFNLLFVAIAILGVYVIVRRVAGVGVGLAVLFLLAFNYTLLDIGSTLLSEALFLGLVSSALVCTVVASPAPGSPGRAAYLAIALAMAAFLTRVAGLAVIVGVATWLWSRRRTPELVTFGIALLVVVGGWFAYAQAVPAAEAGWGYGSDLGAVSGSAALDLSRRLNWMVTKLTGYATSGLPWALAYPTIAGTAIDNVFWLAVTFVLGGVGLVVLLRTHRAVGWYLLLSGVIIAAWPWRIDRLLVPVVPFVIAALLLGADRLTRSFSPNLRIAVLGGLTLLAGIGAIRGAMKREMEGRLCDRSNPYESAGCYNAESRSMVAASHYLRSTAPGGTVVLTVSGAAVNALSGLLTESPHKIASVAPGAVGQVLRAHGVRYVLLTGGRTTERTSFGRRLLSSCRDLRVEARFPPWAMVLVTEPPRVASEDACGPLEELVKSPAGDREPGPSSAPEPETGPQ